MKAKSNPFRYRVVSEKDARLPALAGRNALREASADDLRVLFCILECNGENDTGQLADAAGCSVGRAEASIEYWRSCRILEPREEDNSDKKREAAKKKTGKTALRPADDLAEVTGEETAEIIRRRKLEQLIDEAQKLYGKLFNAGEIAVIAGLAEQLELEEAYILTLCSWCLNRGKKALRYAERTAFSLCEEGIDNIGALEEYIQRKERAASGIGQIRRVFGIGERALTKREDDAFTRWLGEFSFSVEVIGIAYDITVNSTGKATVAYADKILAKWYAAGCRLEADVEAFIEREKKQFTAGKPKPDKKTDDKQSGSFDTDEFFARALERSYGTKKAD